MISTKAPAEELKLKEHDKIIEPIKCNSDNIAYAINVVSSTYIEPDLIIYLGKSEYLPTPTIVEAGKRYIVDIMQTLHGDAGAENLTVTTDEINRIIENSKANQRKSICFVTGTWSGENVSRAQYCYPTL